MRVRLDLIGLVVQDMGRSLAFYRRLGLDVPAAADAEGHVEVAIGAGMRLAWDTVEEVKRFSDWRPPEGGHRIALAFLCGSPAEVDTLHAELIEAGHPSHLDPFDAFWGQRYATILDPDGNPVDLFAPLPSA
ncbi:MAG TPA: VOC family protein [Egibacteraceae bacterium]|nr:VOC family protein [Egibacteraceae bacterium]